MLEFTHNSLMELENCSQSLCMLKFFLLFYSMTNLKLLCLKFYCTFFKVNYVLVPDTGRFLSITFAQPHFRRPVYSRRRYDWSVRTETFGDTFHFFFYIMARGQKQLLGTDCDDNPYDETSNNSKEQQKPITFLQQSDNIDYLNNIEF